MGCAGDAWIRSNRADGGPSLGGRHGHLHGLYHTRLFDDDQMLLSCVASCQRLLVLFICGPRFICTCVFVQEFIFYECVQLSAFIRQSGNLARNAKYLGMPQEVIIY